MSLLRSALLAAVVVAILFASTADAQNKNNRNQPKREKMPSTGVIKGVGPKLLQVETEDGGKWLVSVQARPQAISVVGQADAKWLRAGMLVRFKARFNKRGYTIEPIKELEVVTLREGMRFGMYPAGGLSAGGAAGNLFTDNDDNPKKKTKVKKPNVKIEDVTFNVIGKVGRIRKGKATIAAGRLIKAEIADDAKVLVDVADISIARPGDSVKLDAWYLPNQPGRAVASKVTIAGKGPFSWVSKKKPLPTTVKEGDAKKEDAKEGEAKKDDVKKGDAKKGEANKDDK